MLDHVKYCIRHIILSDFIFRFLDCLNIEVGCALPTKPAWANPRVIDLSKLIMKVPSLLKLDYEKQCLTGNIF